MEALTTQISILQCPGQLLQQWDTPDADSAEGQRLCYGAKSLQKEDTRAGQSYNRKVNRVCVHISVPQATGCHVDSSQRFSSTQALGHLVPASLGTVGMSISR